LFIATMVLGLYFLYRLIDQAQIMVHFPFDVTNDISSYLAQLYFLDVCGYHSFCPYWYNGFTTFVQTAPGWYFFAYPLYKMFNNVQVAAYLSIVLIYAIAWGVIKYYGGWFKFSQTQRNAIFLFFFANAIAIGNHLRRGRPHELLAWVAFLTIAYIALYYKDHKIDKKFYWIIPAFAVAIITYQSIAILSAVVLLSLFITCKERVKITLAGLCSILLTSFWTLPFIKNVRATRLGSGIEAKSEYIPLYTNIQSYNVYTHIALIVIPLLLFAAFWYYKKYTNKNTTFFYPILIINFLILTRRYLPPFLIIFYNLHDIEYY